MGNPNLSNPAVAAYNKVFASQQLPSGDTTIYVVPVNRAAKVATLTLCNTSGNAVTVSVSLLPSGKSIDGTHKVVSSYSLAANDTTSVSELVGALLGEGDYVSVNAGTGSVIDAVMTGVEYG